MPQTSRAFVSLLSLFLAPALAASPVEVSAELRGSTQALLDAIAPGNKAPWEKSLHERFVHLDENGTVRDRAAFLKELEPLPQGLVGHIEIDKWSATVEGGTAVTAYELQEYLDYHGQQLRSRFRSLDTWVATSAGWRLLAEHTAAMLKDPPAIALSHEELCRYEGVYSLTPDIKTTVRCTAAGLTSERTGRPAAAYIAELRDVFFVEGQPRTRRIFTWDAAGKVDGFVDRREGEDVRWRREGPAPPSPRR